MYLRFSSFLIACIIVLGLLALALPVRAQDTGFEDSIFNDVTVRVHQAEEGGLAPVQILRGGDVLLTLDLANPRVDPFDDGLIDVTGDGALNLVVLDQPADGACCYEYHFIEFSDGANLLTTLDAGYRSAWAYWNRDNQPYLEITISDAHFVGWRASVAESPMPRITLKFNARIGGFRAMSDQQYFDDGVFYVWGHPLWGAREDYPWVSGLWKGMLNEIYSGDLAEACEFFSDGWPLDFPGC